MFKIVNLLLNARLIGRTILAEVSKKSISLSGQIHSLERNDARIILRKAHSAATEVLMKLYDDSINPRRRLVSLVNKVHEAVTLNVRSVVFATWLKPTPVLCQVVPFAEELDAVVEISVDIEVKFPSRVPGTTTRQHS